MSKTTYHLENMCCPTEEKMVRRRLEPMAGVERLSFDLLERRLTITHTLDEAILHQTLESMGLGPQPVTTSQDSAGTSGRQAPWAVLGVAGGLALASESLSLSGWAENSAAVVGLAVTAMVLGGRDTLRKGWLALRSLTLNINFLMTIAILGAMVIGEWPEAATVTVLFGVAEALERLAMDRARSAIRKLLELAPELAWLVDEQGQLRETPVGEIQVGQRVRVRPGERIPLDGNVVSGSSSVNQAPITGESMPVEKSAGDPIFAGTINGRGSFDFEVSANRGQTTLDRIIAVVQQAQSDRAPTQRFVDRFARYYTPLMLILATLTAALPPLIWDQAPLEWIYRALVLLVIACPCALVISTPVSVVSGLTAAARAGILIKGGAYLEAGRGPKSWLWIKPEP